MAEAYFEGAGTFEVPETGPTEEMLEQIRAIREENILRLQQDKEVEARQVVTDQAAIGVDPQSETVPPPDQPGIVAAQQRNLGFTPFTGDTASMMGGMGAAALTAPTGPGAIAAGAAGAGAGRMGFNAIDEAYRQYYDEPSRFEGQAGGPAVGNLISGYKEAETDAMFGMGADFLKYPLQALKYGTKKLLGLGDDAATQLAKISENYRIPMGIIHATTRPLIKGIAPVIGVFPYVGGGLTKARKNIDDALHAWSNDMLSVAPTSLLRRDGVSVPEMTLPTLGEMGHQLANAVKKGFNDDKARWAKNYEDYEALANRLGQPEIVPTQNLLDVAEILIKKNTRGLDAAGEPLKQGRSEVMRWMKETQNFKGKMTPQEYRIEINELKSAYAADKKAGVAGVDSWAEDLKKAMENSYSNPVLEGIVDTERKVLSDSLSKANKEYYEGMIKYETPKAQNFGQITKHLFDADFAEYTARNSDEVTFFKNIMNTKSVAGLKQLRELLKDQPGKFDEAAMAHVRNAVERNTKDAKRSFFGKGDNKLNAPEFDLDTFIKDIGLDSPDGVKALDEMLKDMPVSGADWKNFADAHKASKSYKSVSPSTFLQRRVTLGGLGSLLALTTAASSSMLGTLATMFMTRKGMDFFTNPEALRSMTKSFDNSIPNQQRRNAFMRGARLLMGYPKDEPIEPTEEEQSWAQEFLDGFVDSAGKLNKSRAAAESFSTDVADTLLPDDVMSLARDVNNTVTLNKIQRALGR